MEASTGKGKGPIDKSDLPPMPNLHAPVPCRPAKSVSHGDRESTFAVAGKSTPQPTSVAGTSPGNDSIGAPRKGPDMPTVKAMPTTIQQNSGNASSAQTTSVPAQNETGADHLYDASSDSCDPPPISRSPSPMAEYHLRPAPELEWWERFLRKQKQTQLEIHAKIKRKFQKRLNRQKAGPMKQTASSEDYLAEQAAESANRRPLHGHQSSESNTGEQNAESAKQAVPPKGSLARHAVASVETTVSHGQRIGDKGLTLGKSCSKPTVEPASVEPTPKPLGAMDHIRLQRPPEPESEEEEEEEGHQLRSGKRTECLKRKRGQEEENWQSSSAKRR